MDNELLRFYFSFEGRATRYDFNVRFALVAFIGSIIALALDFFLVNGSSISMDFSEPFSNFWGLLVFVSMLAVTCRRLHDLGYSGWWQILAHCLPAAFAAALILSIGMAALMDPMMAGAGALGSITAVLVFYLVFFIFISMKRGTVGPNKYGLDPLEVKHVEQ